MNYISYEVKEIMLKIDMEFKKGILFIRLEGTLNRETKDKFYNEVIALVLKDGIKLIVVNLDRVNSIDLDGIRALMELNDIVNENKGRTTLCSLTNNDVKSSLRESRCSDLFYEASNELTALGVMKL